MASTLTRWIDDATIKVVRTASSPGEVLAAVGITVAAESLDPTHDLYSLVVTDTQGRWWALGLFADQLGEREYPDQQFWDRTVARHHLLETMLSEPVAGPAESASALLDQLLDALGSPEQPLFDHEDFQTSEVHGALHLLNLLDSDLFVETQDALDLLLNLRTIYDYDGTPQGSVGAYLHQVRNWKTSRESNDGEEPTRVAMTNAEIIRSALADARTSATGTHTP